MGGHREKREAMELEYRGYLIKGDGTHGLKNIHSIGQGALPKVMKGSFTNFNFAKQAIDGYLKNKEVKNAKTSSSGRDK